MKFVPMNRDNSLAETVKDNREKHFSDAFISKVKRYCLIHRSKCWNRIIPDSGLSSREETVEGSGN